MIRTRVGANNIILLLLCFLNVNAAMAAECYLDEDHKKVIELNNYEGNESVRILQNYELKLVPFSDLGKIYLPSDYSYSTDSMVIKGEISTTHIFKNAELALYYYEMEVNNAKEIENLLKENDSALELISKSLLHFKNNSKKQFCDKKSILHYLIYTNAFLNRSSKKMAFSFAENSIFLVRDGDINKFEFVVKHNDKSKVWKVSTEIFN